MELNSEVLREFAKRGLSINEGMTVDARLVKSASRLLRNDDLKKEKEKRRSSEGKLDKNGNPVKFHRPPARRAYAPEGTWSPIGR